jgi:hypothetical protein
VVCGMFILLSFKVRFGARRIRAGQGAAAGT